MLIGLVKLIILLLTGLGILALACDFSLRDLRKMCGLQTRRILGFPLIISAEIVLLCIIW